MFYNSRPFQLKFVFQHQVNKIFVSEMVQGVLAAVPLLLEDLQDRAALLDWVEQEVQLLFYLSRNSCL